MRSRDWCVRNRGLSRPDHLTEFRATAWSSRQRQARHARVVGGHAPEHRTHRSSCARASPDGDRGFRDLSRCQDVRRNVRREIGQEPIDSGTSIARRLPGLTTDAVNQGRQAAEQIEQAMLGPVTRRPGTLGDVPAQSKVVVRHPGRTPRFRAAAFTSTRSCSRCIGRRLETEAPAPGDNAGP